MAAAQQASKNKIVVNQLHYNLIYREIISQGLLEYCQKQDIIVTAWSPLEKIDDYARLPKIVEMSRKYGMTAAQLAISWLISQPNVVTISKFSTEEHLRENLESIQRPLSPEDVDSLQKEFPASQLLPYSVPLK